MMKVTASPTRQLTGPIHLVLVRSADEVQRFIFSAQYDIDRVGFSNGRFYFDERIGEAAIRQPFLPSRRPTRKARAP